MASEKGSETCFEGIEDSKVSWKVRIWTANVTTTNEESRMAFYSGIQCCNDDLCTKKNIAEIGDVKYRYE